MNSIVREIKLFSQHFLSNRRILFNLAYNDFKTKYAGSLLGGVWAFIKPIITILVFWFVFQVGLKTTPIDEFPFILWLITGMIPWFFFSDAILGATYSLYEYSYLAKKVKFRVSVLPIVKIISAFFVHFFFFLLIFIMFLFYRIPLSVYNIQVIYYLICLFILLISLSWITSSLAVFLKDVGQFVEVLLQIFIWLTPILWNYRITIPQGNRFWLQLNPLFYITDGFRDAFIYKIWFYDKITGFICFWTFIILTSFIGLTLFIKLRPHFADVL